MVCKQLYKNVTVLLLVGVMLLVLANGAFAIGAPTSTPTPAPKINHFYAAPATVPNGETTTLYWDVSNASEVKIIGIEKQDEGLPFVGQQVVWPETTTSYILVVYGLDGTVISKSLTVNVNASGTVKIEYFKASKTTVQTGETVQLSWKVANGKSVRVVGISPKGNETICPVIGSMEVWPETTTVYLLEATGFNNEVASASITVNVTTPTPTPTPTATPKPTPTPTATLKPTPTPTATPIPNAPKILSFIASKTTIARGDLVTLTWKTENVVKCTLKTSDGHELPNRPANGSIGVTPNKTETYTLIGYAADGRQAAASINIIVQ